MAYVFSDNCDPKFFFWKDFGSSFGYGYLSGRMPDFSTFIPDVIAFSAAVTTTRILERQEFLLREGMVERSLYLVESGALRILYLTELEEHTIRLGYSGSIFASLGSFFNGKPSEFYIQAIRKSQVRVIPKSSLFDFLEKYPDRLPHYNELLQQVIIQQLEREIDLLTEAPAERLQRVLDRSPQLFQEIPAKYIAAYLRMTPETLSRIRNS